MSTSLQIRGARIKVQVEGLSANVDGGQEQGGIVGRVSGNCSTRVTTGATGSSSSSSVVALCLLGEGDEAILDHKVLLDLEVVFPKYLPHGSRTIGASGMGLVQLPGNLEGTFLETPLAGGSRDG